MSKELVMRSYNSKATEARNILIALACGRGRVTLFWVKPIKHLI